MWDVLDHYTIYRPAYVKDDTKYKKHMESIQIFEFLAGLNLEYKEVRVLILRKDPLSTLDEVHAYVHIEELCQGVMATSFNFEKSTLVSSSTRGSHGGHSNRGRGGQSSFAFDNQDCLKCEHCRRSQHIKDQC